ncbi:Gfo/Idh/MocA family protein [uncultured Tateyamaria sp.]|uniref:Gfo/Idh/MocA family protein n=1 Tax=uncultured Tateyamaria sp. TaxID=455651 RepID=UPI0026030AE5|nr:Gfo/Idh/MocA family oxidoreductase [uncultured Tateyamaria sp.]
MNVLMIGAGMVAQTHILALRDNQAGARLMGVLGRDAARVAPVCAEASLTLGYDVAPFTDIETALAARPDMAIVITPPDARTEFAHALSRAGVPTLMEKPVERSLTNAREVVDIYARSDVTLGFCFQHRTRLAAQGLKQKLDGGTLGDLVHVEMRVPWWRDQSYYDAPGRGTYARDGGGVMINQAIHTLDLALWLAGPVGQVQAMMRTSPLHRMEAEDIAAALFIFQTGASGVLTATTTAYPGGTESITLTTTKARCHLEGDSLRVDWLSGDVEIVAPDDAVSTGGGADPMAFTHAWHQAILEDFVAALSETRPPLAPPDDALHVHAVIDAMEQAARSGTVVEVVA